MYDDDDDNNNNNNNNNNTDKWYTHMPKPVCEREMSQCCGIKQYTQTEKLQQIGRI